MADSLSGALATLRRRYGPHVVQPVAALPGAAAWTTGIPVIDDVLTPSGLPLGRVTVLAAATPRGPSGRLTLLQAFLAAASRQGEAGYVDLAETLDPGFLADLGAELGSCLVLAPGAGRWDRGFAMARSLVNAGLPWIALALTGAPPAAQWERQLAAFAEAVSGRRAVAVVAAPAPLARPFAHASSLTLTCASAGWHRAHGDITGLRVDLTTTKSKLGAPGADATVLLRYPRPYVVAEVLGLPSVVPGAAQGERLGASPSAPHSPMAPSGTPLGALSVPPDAAAVQA